MTQAPPPISGERRAVRLSLDTCPASLSPLDRVDLALVLALAALAAGILLTGLGRESLANWDEAIYGSISRNFLSRPGLTLYYASRPWFEKPPLLFWLMAASSSFLGVTEFALRLPSALLGISAIALQYLVGRQLAGRLAGVAAALFLLGVPQFVAYSRLAMMDVPLTTLGMMSFALLLYGERKRWATVLAGIPFGLAILTKSAAAFLFLPGLLALTLSLHGVRFLRCREAILAAALTLIVALPWHIWAALTYGWSFLSPYFVFHVLRRFAQPLESHEGGFFSYFDLYRHSAGWLAFIHAAGIALIAAMAIRQRNSRLAAIVTLPIGAFLIVNLQATKIGWYLTPVYPGTALVAALALAMLFRKTRARAIAILLGIVLAVPGIIDGRDSFVDSYNILDFSPEVRSLRNTPPFLNRVALLYTLNVADPAPRFYLADRVEAIDQQGLERLIAKREPFLCLAFKEEAYEYLHNHPRAKLKIAASTESLAMIEYR